MMDLGENPTQCRDCGAPPSVSYRWGGWIGVYRNGRRFIVCPRCAASAPEHRWAGVR